VTRLVHRHEILALFLALVFLFPVVSPLVVHIVRCSVDTLFWLEIFDLVKCASVVGVRLEGLKGLVLWLAFAKQTGLTSLIFGDKSDL
jgi:hypothetical protein